MRLGRRGIPRRGILLGVGAAGLGLAAAGVYRARAIPRGSDEVRAVAVEARPLGPLLPSEPDRRTFGDLTFRSGLVLTSNDTGFGGLSGLWRSPDGARLVAVSDNAQWLTATVQGSEGILGGLADAAMAPILGEIGAPLRHGPAYDTESLAIADGVAYVAIERVHEVRRFARWGSEGVRSRGVPLPIPREIAGLSANRGLEAVGVAPPGHPLAGALVVVAEGNDDDASSTPGWVLTGRDRLAFEVARSDAFNITDMQFLPSGELLLLERHFSLVRGVACRMRRIAADAIRPGARLDGRVLFTADRSYAIDNMEGLALHRDPAGEMVLTLMSDDNFSPIQRTVMMEFTLAR